MDGEFELYQLHVLLHFIIRFQVSWSINQSFGPSSIRWAKVDLSRSSNCFSPQSFSWIVHIFFLHSISLCHLTTFCVVFPRLVSLQSSLPTPSSSSFHWTLSECAPHTFKLSLCNLLHKIPVFSKQFQNLIIWHKSSPANLEHSPVAPHLKSIYPSFCFLCQCPRLWSICKTRKDLGFNDVFLYCDVDVASQKFFILQESHLRLSNSTFFSISPFFPSWYRYESWQPPVFLTVYSSILWEVSVNYLFVMATVISIWQL